MGGTKAGGIKAAKVNQESDADFYRRIGRLGGAASNTGGFAAGKAGRIRARMYGAIGGAISSRGGRKLTQHLLAIHEKERGRVV